MTSIVINMYSMNMKTNIFLKSLKMENKNLCNHNISIT